MQETKFKTRDNKAIHPTTEVTGFLAINNKMAGGVSREVVDSFFRGRDPMERIVKIECGYNDTSATVIYRDKNGKKKVLYEDFKPFCWVSDKAECMMFGGDRKRTLCEIPKYGIVRKELRTRADDGTFVERMENGFRYLYQAEHAMSYSAFLRFFDNAGAPIFDDRREEQIYMTISPVEQHMVYTGKRMYKGYDDYDDIVRMTWMMSKDGGDPSKDRIDRIAIRTNNGFSKIIKADTKDANGEANAVKLFFETIKNILPDVITGYGNEGAEGNFLVKRMKHLGTSVEDISSSVFKHPIYRAKRKSILKIGSDIEYYNRMAIWGISVTDSLHAIRRAQTQDTSMKSCDMSYVCEHSKTGNRNVFAIPKETEKKLISDKRRIYELDKESFTWIKHESEGNLFKTGEEVLDEILDERLRIIEETELMYNRSNFLVCKMIPVTFERACTMGSASLWKSVMTAWSYEHSLAIPVPSKDGAITGGLSKLFSVGFVRNVAKYDYNSMYPSIALTYGIRIPTDILNVMPSMLELILGEREMYKGLMKVYGANAENMKDKFRKEGFLRKEDEERLRDNEELCVKYSRLQSPFKIFAVSWFGGISSDTFPWNEPSVGEEITCIGRQMFRLLIAHFHKKLGYKAIVGASVTGDTPLYIKYDDSGLIDIMPISEMFDESKHSLDPLGREYDTSEKPYSVLCESGWVKASYIYRYRAKKPVLRVSDGKSSVDCTEDHSVFLENGKKTVPGEIKQTDRLLYYNGKLQQEIKYGKYDVQTITKWFKEGLEAGMHTKYARVPTVVLNGDQNIMESYLYGFLCSFDSEVSELNKTLLAGLMRITSAVNKKRK